MESIGTTVCEPRLQSLAATAGALAKAKAKAKKNAKKNAKAREGRKGERGGKGREGKGGELVVVVRHQARSSSIQARRPFSSPLNFFTT